MLIEETTVPTVALPVEPFRAHLRLGRGFSEDGLQDDVLVSFLQAALAAIEARTGKAILERTFRWSVNAWREAGVQPLPLAPIKAITGVEIVDRTGSRTGVAADSFWLEQEPGGGRVRSVATAFPGIPTGGRAEITFVAGFSDAWDLVPADLRQAVLLLAAHYYEYREETSLSRGCMPFGVSSLIERYRSLRLSLGGVQ